MILLWLLAALRGENRAQDGRATMADEAVAGRENGRLRGWSVTPASRVLGATPAVPITVSANAKRVVVVGQDRGSCSNTRDPNRRTQPASSRLTTI